MNNNIESNNSENKNGKKKREPNYRGLFIIGISLIAVGTSFISLRPKIGSLGIVFIAVGGLFMMFSIKNKEKWMGKK